MLIKMGMRQRRRTGFRLVLMGMRLGTRFRLVLVGMRLRAWLCFVRMIFGTRLRFVHMAAGTIAVIMIERIGNGIHKRYNLHMRGVDCLKERIRPDLGLAADAEKKIASGNLGNIEGTRLVIMHLLTGRQKQCRIDILAADLSCKIILREDGADHIHPCFRMRLRCGTAMHCKQKASCQKSKDLSHAPSFLHCSHTP